MAESKSSEVIPDRLTGERVRWEFPVVVLTLASIIVVVLGMTMTEDRTTQVIYGYYTCGIAFVSLVVWWSFFSGFSRAVRIGGIMSGVAAVAIFVALFRFEGYTGDFFPIFSLRSSPSAEQRAVDYFQSQSGDPGNSAAGDGKPLVVTDADWPQFRGLRRTGVVQNASIRRDWDKSPPKQLWKHPVGLGWSSFAVVGGLAFTQEQRGSDELVVCYDVETGKQLWSHADTVRFTSEMGGHGPRGTPTVYDSRLYTLGATGILNCLEPRTGRVIWTRDILKDAEGEVAQFGMSTSPFICDNMVVLNAGGDHDKGVIAYNHLNGDIIWAKGNRRAGYASPILATFGDSRQLLIFGADGLAGHDAGTGDELWWFEWKNDTGNNCVDPLLLADNTIFLSTGYGRGTVLLEVKQTDGKWEAEPIRWKTSKRFKAKISGAVVKDGLVYGLDENILCCFDPAIGKARWKSGRYGYGQLLLVGDVLLISSETGDVALVEAKPDAYREIASFHAIDGKTWNHPALYRGLLLVRNDEEAACFDLRPEVSSK